MCVGVSRGFGPQYSRFVFYKTPVMPQTLIVLSCVLQGFVLFKLLGDDCGSLGMTKASPLRPSVPSIDLVSIVLILRALTSSVD